MKAKLLLVSALVLFSVLSAHAIDKQKLDTFATAVAHAEGFGVHRAVPTRYHNPGDIRSTRNGHHYAGQIGLNRSGYVIFKNDAYGWAALKDQLVRMASGQSAHYGTDMTITKVAKVYATGWRVWSKNVSKELGVEPNTTLRAYFADDEPPSLDIPATEISLLFEPAIPVLAQN